MPEHFSKKTSSPRAGFKPFGANAGKSKKSAPQKDKSFAVQSAFQKSRPKNHSPNRPLSDDAPARRGGAGRFEGAARSDRPQRPTYAKKAQWGVRGEGGTERHFERSFERDSRPRNGFKGSFKDDFKRPQRSGSERDGFERASFERSNERGFERRRPFHHEAAEQRSERADFATAPRPRRADAPGKGGAGKGLGKSLGAGFAKKGFDKGSSAPAKGFGKAMRRGAGKDGFDPKQRPEHRRAPAAREGEYVGAGGIRSYHAPSRLGGKAAPIKVIRSTEGEQRPSGRTFERPRSERGAERQGYERDSQNFQKRRF